MTRRPPVRQVVTCDLTNLTRWTVDTRLVNRVLAAAAGVLRLRRPRHCSVVLVHDALMKRLNSHYRGKQSVTDVLSFATLDDDRSFVNPDPAFLGEIILCVPQLRRQARTAGVPLEREFSLLLGHGVFHLAGYDHERTAREAAWFERAHRQLLGRLGFSPRDGV